MAILATDKGGSNIEPIKSGTHMGRCIQMIHIGTLTETMPDGKVTTRNLCRFTFELPNEMHTFDESRGAEPRLVSKEFTLSMNAKSSLRKFLDTWRGVPFTENEAKSFDVTALIGIPCMLAIGMKVSATGNKYNTIDSALAIPTGVPVAEQIGESLECNFDNLVTMWEKIPGFIQDKIIQTPEFIALNWTPPAKDDAQTTDPQPEATTTTGSDDIDPITGKKKMPF